MSSIIKVQNIQYTDGDAALTIADGGGVTLSDDLSLADNKKIKLGTGNDLEIYHNGSESYIADVGTGGVKFRASTIRWEKNDGSETLGGVDADGGWFFKANNTTALNIDAAGDITKPLQPMYHGVRTGTRIMVSNGYAINTQHTVMFTEIIDVANNFNTSTYTFTFPTAGKYLMSTKQLVYGGSSTGYVSFDFMVNSTTQCHVYQDVVDKWQSISGSCLVNVSANDTCHIQWYFSNSDIKIHEGNFGYFNVIKVA